MLSFAPSIHTAVKVAPMPCWSGFSSADLKMFLLARWTAVERRFVRALQLGCTSPMTSAEGLVFLRRPGLAAPCQPPPPPLPPRPPPPPPHRTPPSCSHPLRASLTLSLLT